MKSVYCFELKYSTLNSFFFFIAGNVRKGAITTIGIGDGGNEIGMGNVKEKVIQHIRNGEDIACNVAVNHLITAGVSNWGGWALAMAVFVLQNCLIHSRYSRHGIGEHCERSQKKVLNTVDQVTIQADSHFQNFQNSFKNDACGKRKCLHIPQRF
jgi:hypothetical protein